MPTIISVTGRCATTLIFADVPQPSNRTPRPRYCNRAADKGAPQGINFNLLVHRIHEA